MPITSNDGGSLYMLDTITKNDGGSLYEQHTITSNEGGSLYVIHEAIPQQLTWTADTAADSSAKVNNVSDDGFDVNFTSSALTTYGTTLAIKSNTFYIPSGKTIEFAVNTLSSVASTDTVAHCYIYQEDGTLVTMLSLEKDSIPNSMAYTVASSGRYYLMIGAGGVTGESSGVKYYSATANAEITIL